MTNVKGFRDFLHSLEVLDWMPAGHIGPKLLCLLSELGGEPGLTCSAVISWTEKNLERRQLSCHETSTHYKWFVHYHGRLRYRIWLHQYKPLAERKVGHAEVPHNHRYSLASVVLSGGFVHHSFDRVNGGLTELEQERRCYSQGDVYTVDWQRLHKLSSVRERTVTLVVESPVVRHFSEAFYNESGAPSRFYDFVELHSRLSRDITILPGGMTG